MNLLSVSHTLYAPAGEFGAGGGTSGGKLAQAKETVARTARETASQLKSAAADTTSRAKAQVERAATEKKQNAASRIESYSSAMRDSARSLEEKDPNIAWFTNRAADRLQGVADYVRTRDFSGVRDDAADMARRHPALFFGGLFVAGLILGNVVKAGSRRRRDESHEYEEFDPARGDDSDYSNDWEPQSGSTVGATSEQQRAGGDVRPNAGSTFPNPSIPATGI